MVLINWKIELKFKWTNHCVLSVAGADSNNDNSNNIIIFIKDTKLYIPVVTLSAKNNQKLSKLLRRSVYWNECKTKSKNNDRKNEYRYFLESQFGGVSRLLALIYLNKGDDDAKRYKARSYFFTKMYC